MRGVALAAWGCATKRGRRPYVSRVIHLFKGDGALTPDFLECKMHSASAESGCCLQHCKFLTIVFKDYCGS